MKSKDLLDAMNDIDDEYVRFAEEERPRPAARARRWMGIGLAACVCLAAAGGAYAIRHSGAEDAPRSSDSSGGSGQNQNGMRPAGGEDISDSAAGNKNTQPAKESEDLMQNGEMIHCADYALVQAQYPQRVTYPSSEMTNQAEYKKQINAYYEQYREGREQQSGLAAYRESLFSFCEKTMRELLICEENENRAYSPLNLYMTLSMLSELTGGNSRAQLFALLDAQDISAVRESARALWEASYAADGIVESRLANSVWLKQGIDFVPETIERLADTYYASAFQGDTASPEFTRALQQWLNDQTGGLLQEQAAGIELKKETLLALAGTFYFRAQWSDEFKEEDTREGIFHAASGDMTCDFMHQEKDQTYYRGSNFSALCRSLDFSGGMWLFLPDEGVTVNEMLGGEEILQLVKENKNWENKKIAKVNLSMPKFDIASDFDLKESLKVLGVTDVFEEELADFSPVIAQQEEPLYLSEARHAARVMVDEKGCTAAALTALAVSAAGAPLEQEKVDFILDRPFLFAIAGEEGTILFMGVVENVSGQ